MPIKRNFLENNFYHVYSRGVEKRIIFIDESDYKRFLDSIFYFSFLKNKRMDTKSRNQKSEPLVDILCFTLMPNHFHMKIREIKEGGISKYMQKLITSYTMYFNKKYNRFGSLFGTRFKDKIIDKDSYFSYLDFYIKCNCIKNISPKYDVYKIFTGEIQLSKFEREYIQKYQYYWKKG